MMPSKRNHFFSFFTILSIIFLNSCIQESKKPDIPLVQTFFLDVGQGDAQLLKDQNQSILIDVGPSSHTLLPKLEKYQIDTLDLVIITHNDLDHNGALLDLTQRYPIKRLWVGPDSGGTYMNQVAQVLRQKRIPIDTVYRGQEANFNHLSLRILWPLRSSPLQGNAASLVSQISWMDTRILNTGDLEEEQELQLMDWESDLSATILKVGHHGSKTSSSLAFLGRVSPTFAAISVGASNTYGHPNASSLANIYTVLRDSSRLLRTDLKGDLSFEFSENGIVSHP